MFKRRLSFSDVFLILINLVPLYGVWFESWNPIEVFIVYCLETVIAGLMTIVKMAMASYFAEQPQTTGSKKPNRFALALFMIGFFILHYGIFVFVQTQMFLSIAGIGGDGSTFMKYVSAGRLLGRDGILMFVIFIAWYSYDLVTTFFLSGKFRSTSVIAIMFQPYGRIFVQQVIVILGSLFLMLKMPGGFILVFVAVKTLADLVLNRYLNSRRKDAFGSRQLTGE
ncbi:MAG: DUF6498-containing protein [Ferruginibacter sp.]